MEESPSDSAWQIGSIRPPSTCLCCGESFDSDARRMCGPYFDSPYIYVCKACHDLPFVYYPDKKPIELPPLPHRLRTPQQTDLLSYFEEKMGTYYELFMKKKTGGRP